jgi:nicotinate-nucleotide--dimethylbenzimidazole phosphoribosyltransferase
LWACHEKLLLILTLFCHRAAFLPLCVVTGVDDAGLQVKQAVVQEALAANGSLIQQGPLQALQAVGGLELAAMTGAYLEAARRGMPAVVDGYISGAAALAAVRQQPQAVRQCLFLSHQSVEAQHCGGQRLIAELGCGQPVLQLGLRLGEGTGALLAVPLLRSAAAIMRDMAALQDVLAAE